jgi:hypothetical protein
VAKQPDVDLRFHRLCPLRKVSLHPAKAKACMQMAQISLPM